MKKNLTEKQWTKLRKVAEKDAEQWLAERKSEAKKIKAQTTDVTWAYTETFDPYGIGPHPLLPTLQQVGREYFARRPGCDIWVWFGDLPRATAKALWRKHGAKLSFPAGIDLSDLPKSPRKRGGKLWL
jgi:hypothetical protein